MKVLLINAMCGVTSTGRICADLAESFKAQGHEVRVAFGRDPLPERCRSYAVRIGSETGVRLNGIKTRLMDNHGRNAAAATRSFLKWADDYNPDLLWLHNLHGYYLHYEMLFDWIKSRPQMKVQWTLHDCWSFTGHCVYFSMAGCDRWQTGCHHCPQKGTYPASLLRDGSEENYRRKKQAFTGVKDLTLITPSEWLKALVQQSFLREYPVRVVPNEINREVFRPTPGDFREKYGLTGKKLVLGVGTEWSERKGLPDYVALSGLLDDSWRIVLVGLQPKQIASLPPNMLGLPRTDSARELAQIYTAADVLVSCSREEVFGMTIVEADACGTPSVVYQGTACEEVALHCGGKAVPMDVQKLKEAILETVK